MKRTLVILIAVLTASVVTAQPSKRRTTTSNAAAQQGAPQAKGTDRASLMFPTSDAMPEDVAWRRDIYRQLDLTKDKNAPLYYPIQPIGKQCNLFTYLFRLLLSGRVNAYDYKITGNESFDPKDKVVVKDFLMRYSIYYEENGGKVSVADADVPSEQVKRYYIKESSYLDQRTGTTHTKVQAICPILLEGGEFGEDAATPQPLFWMKYDDVAPYLSKLPVMASDLNNVTNMTADDYFTMNRYEGKIYKTNNMQGKVIADYCKTDSDMVKEQRRIEKQLTDFEDHLWGHVELTDTLDSTQVETPKTTKKSRQQKDTTTVSSTSRRTKSKSDSASEASPAPRVSARRQRR
ncbi:MAG: gliding motility protein GldN [Bacteroidales bacterium]|nr:gliding motility protein GldN [Candidatus Physcousia equi]